MSKKTKRLEKENMALSRKSDLMNRNILEMAEERTRQQRELENSKKKSQKLEDICRALQSERNALENKLRGAEEEYSGEEGEGSEDEGEEGSEYLSEEGDDEDEEETEDEGMYDDEPETNGDQLPRVNGTTYASHGHEVVNLNNTHVQPNLTKAPIQNKVR